MKKSEWSDERIEKLLGQMPKLTDHRNPQDIHQNIAGKLGKRKRQAWLMPGLATAAALILFFILAPELLDWRSSPARDTNLESAERQNEGRQENKIALESNSRADKAEKNSQQESTADIQTNPEENNQNTFAAKGSDALSPLPERTAVYEDDLNGQELLTYALPADGGNNIVPISVLVANEEKKPWLDLYKKTAGQLMEETWGLDEYYPLKAELSMDETKRELTINFAADSQYGQGSRSEITIPEVLEQNFAGKVDTVILKTAGEPGLMLGNNGPLNEINLASAQSTGDHGYFFLNQDGRAQPLLVPSSKEYNTIDEAFIAMQKQSTEGNLIPSIPSHFEITPGEKNAKLLSVELKGSENNENAADLVYTVEAILLTAKDFGYEAVILKNDEVKSIGGFPVAEVINVPLGANKQNIRK
ncbi:negative regulator of sigma-X activity [Bacillus canaveralius]|uniref:Negative regulator of sigma-X activity n=1 Tax=Bacillus canaveralius TaxID=1403243 RepID=A0A2N5GRP2_9BACI|nr:MULTISPECIES: negative regulator of sigma-X activity [Bacillus]PLR84585.1 negative regulator of sigma-X activity [Bacillus sp. V33-4]PLR86099.1 negative regulator of sigma-X activity [Bacillus canaveralius]PLS00219.1 negative regulator of sigma-X activity [Bacillus canaveralius]RSK52017.1 negative regulator of sigma-X activity [Bacillus canaveralius]